MNNVLGRFLGNLFGRGKAWWIEIKTNQPACTYYFGPFDSELEAMAAKGGRVVRPPGAMKHCTTVIAFVEDPDGYKVE